MFLEVTLALLGGFLSTLKLFALTLVIALPLGLIISFGSMSRIPVIRKPVKFIIWVIRGTPLMLQLILIFFGPGVIFGHQLWGGDAGGRFIAALVAFSINYACYFSEIYRGGIESISKGQYEAGQVLGMTKVQIFFKVVLFQVIKRIVPPISNEIITLVKDTSLARVVSVAEIIMSAERFTKKGLIWPLFSTGIYFLVFNGVLTLLFGYIEKKLDYYKN